MSVNLRTALVVLNFVYMCLERKKFHIYNFYNFIFKKNHVKLFNYGF